MPLLSIIIDNYNNEAYLSQAIDTALEQALTSKEVIVVDDGSTDNSVRIMDQYNERIVSVQKNNGGQASALNAGFEASHGEIVIFLDADDKFASNMAAARVVELMTSQKVTRLHWPMRVIDKGGSRTGDLTSSRLDGGQLGERVRSFGPFAYEWSSTSGNAWPRWFLNTVMPIPEVPFRQCADNYLSTLAPLYGPIGVTQPLTSWRRHTENFTATQSSFTDRLRDGLKRFDGCLAATRSHCKSLGLDFDPSDWYRNAWFYRIERAADVIDEHVAVGRTFILIDDDQWGVGNRLYGRTCVPFLQRDRRYDGRPATDEQAVREMQALLHSTESFGVAVGWTCFWWLERYPRLRGLLREQFSSVVHRPDVILYYTECNDEDEPPMGSCFNRVAPSCSGL